ncbi:MAG: hypothetical protein M3P43_13270 [Actinomycetota bacterium]|nr:hypothetical protein [Actinomycetota bacterium]
MGQAALAQGCTLDFGGTGLELVTNIQGLGPENSDVDVTSHSSLNNTREFIAGLIDPGELTLDLDYDFNDPGQQALFDNALAAASDPAGSTQSLTITLPDGTSTFTVDAYVKSFKVSLPADGSAQTAVAVLRTTGPVTPGFS